MTLCASKIIQEAKRPGAGRGPLFITKRKFTTLYHSNSFLKKVFKKYVPSESL